MSKYVVVAIDWTGRSQDQAELNAVEAGTFSSCGVRCKATGLLPGEIRLLAQVGNCQITTQAKLLEPEKVFVWDFAERSTADRWASNCMKYFDFTIVLPPAES